MTELKPSDNIPNEIPFSEAEIKIQKLVIIVKRNSSYIIISLIQYFEADFLWKVSLKILNSEILKTFTHADIT